MHVELTTLNLPKGRTIWAVDLVAGDFRYSQDFFMSFHGYTFDQAVASANYLANFLKLPVKTVEHTVQRTESVEIVDAKPTAVERHE